jgi:molybdopterin converting factor small subunit
VSLLGRLIGDRVTKVRVHLLVKGRIGPHWFDVDRTLELPEGSTLSALLDQVEQGGLDLRAAIAESPHLAHTLMINGERCPLAENVGRLLSDGDQIYLLSPLAGG